MSDVSNCLGMCYIQIRCESCWFSFVSRCCKLPHMNFFKRLINCKSYQESIPSQNCKSHQESIPSQSFHHQLRQSMWMKSFIVNFNIILCILIWKMTCCDFKSFLFWLDLAISMTWLLQPYDLTQLTWLADESGLALNRISPHVCYV